LDNKTAILEAHVQFELQKFSGEALKKTLHEEIAALFAWFAQVKTNEVVNSSQIMALIQRTVIELPITDELTDFIRENVIVAFEYLQDDKTSVAEIFPRPIFDQIVEAIVGMEKLRHEVTHQLVSSPPYSMLIANVLYHGIKGFALSENAFSRNVPGASSLFKLGQNALSAAAPKLEKNVDKQLITFINANIQQTINESEQFLNKSLDDKLIRKIGDEVWAAQSTEPMSRLAGYLDSSSLEQVVEIVQEFWLHYRQTPLFYELVQGVVHSFFLRYGRKPVRFLLDEIGITADMVAQEAYALAEPFAEKALASGYLEERIRQRLDAFYSTYSAA